MNSGWYEANNINAELSLVLTVALHYPQFSPIFFEVTAIHLFDYLPHIIPQKSNLFLPGTELSSADKHTAAQVVKNSTA
ncbi:MAG TPA: hypothetical protein VLX91_12085 [Candidatus Acidoferrales bacterium]|nr:hypothetical protein [Candidatus Acidoferrales bacterium]